MAIKLSLIVLRAGLKRPDHYYVVSSFPAHRFFVFKPKSQVI